VDGRPGQAAALSAVFGRDCRGRRLRRRAQRRHRGSRAARHGALHIPGDGPRRSAVAPWTESCVPPPGRYRRVVEGVGPRNRTGRDRVRAAHRGAALRHGSLRSLYRFRTATILDASRQIKRAARPPANGPVRGGGFAPANPYNRLCTPARSRLRASAPPRPAPRLRTSQHCRARTPFVALLQRRQPYSASIGSGASADTAAANPNGADPVRPDSTMCFSEAPGMAAREQSLPSDRGRTNHNPSGPFPFPPRFGSNSVRGYVAGEELDYPERQRHPSGRDTLTFRLLSQVQDGLRWRDGRIGLHGHLGQHGQVGHLRMKRVPVPHLRSTRCSPLGNY
jgi:hypothetical protein